MNVRESRRGHSKMDYPETLVTLGIHDWIKTNKTTKHNTDNLSGSHQKSGSESGCARRVSNFCFL